MAKKTAFLAYAIALLGFALRVARLDFQSLRGDESFSVWFSSGSLDSVFNLLATQEPHPPLYYTALHFWMSVVGDSEFSVRYLSVAAGMLVVPVTFAIGRVLIKPLNRLSDDGGTRPSSTAGDVSILVALLASFLIAINPLLIWHSQDARMYSFLSFFAAASVLFSIGGLPSRKKWCLYVLATYLAMLSHYSSFFVIATENVVVVLFMLVQRKDLAKSAFRWVTAQTVLVTAYLPWLCWTWSLMTSHASDWIQPVDLATILERSFVALGVGTTVSAEARTSTLLIVAIVVLVAIAATARLMRKGDVTPLVFASLYLFGPLFLLFVFSLQRPMFDERHLVVIVPAFAVLAACGGRGLIARPGPGGFLVALLLGGLAAMSLYNYYLVPDFNKGSGWRALAAEIRKSEEASDYILLNYPDPTFAYYYRGKTPFSMLPARVPIDRAETEKELTALTAAHPRIWLVPVHAGNWDADGFVEKWLDAHTKKLGEADFEGTRLELFSVD